MQLPWLILAPMTLERNALAKALRHVDPSRYRIELIGMRAIQLPKIEADQYCGVILAGIAGGLAPGITNGDIVAESSIPMPPLETTLLNGTFFCSTCVVPFAEGKQAIYDKTECYAIEMESNAARSLATQHELPFVHVRGISDSAEDTINPILMLLSDDFGRPRMKRVLTVLLTQPRLIKEMMSLGKNAKAAAKAAAECVKEIITSDILE